ncbi:hypothetical protein DPMN_093735 [Dreissena polymorpha]|uniref:Uncharacterized protein n=1 Tax=Dreissena polymorpha TaxID=45954 RepID=A0A9D4L3I1_DREPO|nr:hypothetical protein DPMN_093735 [Dreissena polymorpha]
MFHEDQTINVASRVKNAPLLGSHVFQANVTIFKLIQDIIKTNLLTKFHEDLTINVASRALTRKNAPPLNSRHLTQNKPIPQSAEFGDIECTRSRLGIGHLAAEWPRLFAESLRISTPRNASA